MREGSGLERRDRDLLGLRTIATYSDDAMLSVDIAGTVVSWNPAAERIFGYSAEEAIGIHISRLYPPERSTELVEIYKRVGKEGRVSRLETVRRTKDDRRIHVALTVMPMRDPRGRIVGMSSVVRDITAQKQAEAALSEEQEFVSTLMDTAGALVIVLDDEARILRFNRACERVSGYAFAEVQGRSVWPMIPPDQEGEVKRVFDHLVSDRSPSTFENDWVSTNGSRRRIAWVNTPILGDGGSIKYILCVGIDITERRRMEEALRRNRAELRSLTARLLGAEEESRRLLARELHDQMSQDLAALAIDLEILLRELPPSRETVKEHLEDYGRRVGRLSEDVRSMAHQLHPSILEDLGLPAALGLYCEEVSRRFGMPVSFRTHRVLELTKETATCLYRVAQEALQNAARHSGSERVMVRVGGTATGALLSVRDTGVGFDPGTTRGGERGLGVISMEERVRVVGGRLSVRSRPGRGTRVRVWVPLEARSRKPVGPAS